MRDDVAGADPVVPEHPAAGLAVDVDVVFGPQRDRRGPGGAGRRADLDGLADAGAAVVTDGRVRGFGLAQLLLDGDGDLAEVGQLFDVVGRLDAGFLELALEER